MSKVEQLNELLHRELAEGINRGGDSRCFRDRCLCFLPPICNMPKWRFRSCRTEWRIAALKKLKAASGRIAAGIVKKTRLRRVPHLLWGDPTERKAAILEDVFLRIDEEDENDESL